MKKHQALKLIQNQIMKATVKRFFGFILFLGVGLFIYDQLQSSRLRDIKQTNSVPLKREITKSEKKTLDYRSLRRKAIDSLIDNNIATPENFAKIKKMFPDSLCNCI